MIVKTIRDNFALEEVWVDVAQWVWDAIYKIKNNIYDIIVSEYDTWELKTWQQVLEQVRIEQLAPWTTSYIIITNQEEKKKEIEKVILTWEYYPDEYILKPLTEWIVSEKLDETIKKKKYLWKIYESMFRKDYKEAIKYCDKLINSKKYIKDIIRLKLVCYLKLEDYEAIKKMYTELNTDKDYSKITQIGWFKYAYANALFSLWIYEEAEKISDEIKKEFPNYLENFKLLAEILHAERKDLEAIEVLKQAIDLSPMNIEKQQILWKISLFSWDLETSKSAYETIITKWKWSPRYSINDHADLANVFWQLWEYDEALKVIWDWYESFLKEPDTKFVTAVVESQILAKKWDVNWSKAAFELALKEFKKTPDLKISSNVQLYFWAECLEHWEKELWEKMINEWSQWFVRKDVVKSHLWKVLRWEEHIKILEGIIDNSWNDGITLFQKATDKIKSWDWKWAISVLTQQLYDEPESPFSYFNLAKVKIRYTSKNSKILSENEYEFDKQLVEILSLVDKGKQFIKDDTKKQSESDIRTIDLMIKELKKSIEKEKEKQKKLPPELKTWDDGLDDLLPDVML